MRAFLLRYGWALLIFLVLVFLAFFVPELVAIGAR